MHFHSLAKLPSPPFLPPALCTKEMQIHVNISQSLTGFLEGKAAAAI